MENIVFKEFEGIKYIQFKRLLDLGITHCYTLKSEGIDFTRGNPNEKQSYDKICKALEISKESLLIPKQAHTDNIKCVNFNTKEKDLIDTDGLITDKKGITLVSKNADCILFLFYDPVKNVIANIHSGWRGTFKKIAEKAVLKMINNYECKPENILCFINPSIRKCHFEVDEDVKELCKEIFEFTKKTEDFIEFGETKDGKQKYLIDTVLINKLLLLDIRIKRRKYSRL